jgi:dTMP kinase
MEEAFEELVFVVLDGLDASGKSTQAIGLCMLLKESGKTACLRIHPSKDSLFGVKARQFLHPKGKSAHFASAFFYMLDVVRSILLYSWQKYDYVIFVRYLMGTAYLPSPVDRISYDLFITIVPTPDYMFFLDVYPEEADRRIRQTRNSLEMFETLEDLERIRRKALSLVSTGNWTVINGNKLVKNIKKEIAETLELPF